MFLVSQIKMVNKYSTNSDLQPTGFRNVDFRKKKQSYKLFKCFFGNKDTNLRKTIKYKSGQETDKYFHSVNWRERF